MKTKFFVMAAMAAMFSMSFTACSNSDEEMGSIAKGSGIGFDVHADGPAHVTRGYATTAANALSTIASFQTWAYDDVTNGLYMGVDANTGRTVEYASSTWGYTPQQFWPVNALNFVAVTPVAAPTGGTLTHAVASASNVVTLTSTFVNPTTVANQVDLMYAEADGITKDGADGTASTADDGNVPFTFKHALSQVVFKGKLPSNGAVTKVTISEISLCNINSSATLTFDSEGYFYGSTSSSTVLQPATSGTAANFTLTDTELEESVWDTKGASPNATAGTAFNLTVSNNATKKNAWFMVPQTTAAWAGPAAINASPASGAYLKIRAKLEKDGVTILNDAATDALYIPLAVNWDRSKKYIYTIEFNGANALTPITFSVAAQDWTETDEQPINM